MTKTNGLLHPLQATSDQTLRLCLSSLCLLLFVSLPLCIVFTLDSSASFISLFSLLPRYQDLGWPTKGYQKYDSGNEFRWGDLTPSRSLNYVPCFGPFQCARLSVPLDWNSTNVYLEDGPRVAVAVIKLPAIVPVTDPRYGGPVLLNPGGPGESGVYQVLSDAFNIRTVLDAGPSSVPPMSPVLAENKYFDIVSFDPRGVNNTTPRLICFPDEFNQQTWRLRQPDYGFLWESDSIVGMEWAMANALGASCEGGTSGDENIVRYSNTAQTATDMLAIIEKEGERRQLTAMKPLLNVVDPGRRRLVGRELNSSIAMVNYPSTYRPGHEKLQYWGMSYGTLLGATFAALYPDRVGRIVLDGVVDPADHYAGRWLTQLQDTDMIVSKLCEYCSLAGPSRCPLSTNVSTSADDIETRFTSLLLSLKKYPIPVARPGDGPEMITYGDLHLSLLSGMYFPFAMADTLFETVAAIERRNSSASSLARIVAAKQASLHPQKRHTRDNNTGASVPYVSGSGPMQVIGCMDMGGATNLTLESFTEYLAELRSQSKWISSSWARNRLACEGFSVHPAWRPELTFKTQEWANTSHPLLIVGNSHDTVTPLNNARRVASLFPGSVVLHQDSEGHCSHSSPSRCTALAIRRYFQAGVMPPANTVCTPDTRPFIGCIADDADVSTDSNGMCRFHDREDQRLWEAMVELADPFGLRVLPTDH